MERVPEIKVDWSGVPTGSLAELYEWAQAVSEESERLAVRAGLADGGELESYVEQGIAEIGSYLAVQ